MAPESSQPAKKRRTYRCRRCGFPKKGHVCAAAAAAPGDLPLLPSPEEEEKVDGISALPDDVVHTIISLLPTMGGAKTQVLSSRWLPLWRSAPLNLDDAEIPDLWEDFLLNVITEIITDHRGPTWRLSITKLARVNEFRGDLVATLDDLLRSGTLDGLEELRFHYRPNMTAPDPLPPAATRFSCLRVASFGFCSFPGAGVLGGVAFPNLQELTLLAITNSEDTLHAMISACPVLRSLLLRDNDAFRRVRISSPTLVSLGLCSRTSDMEELIIDNTPSLERLLMFRSSDKLPRVVSVFSAPKLEVLGCLSDGISDEHYGVVVWPQQLRVNSMAMLRTVKILAFRIEENSLDATVHILRCFPCVQKLHITLAEGLFVPDIHNGLVDDAAAIECLDLHLKEIVVRNYRGQKSHAAFAKFFVLNASVLKVMTFRACVRLSKKWLSNQRRLLRLREKASPNARFEFSCDGYFMDYYYNHSQRSHQLSVGDPFDD
ncbi:hypothetical protein OsI_25655 [Oryza sativa Indica Group]|uniref:Uncharacterized protein n=1 Tax=Oryza sativa subsp. indica TaxID=39946 RepID=A2YKA8_ORYSI|nr:hypothetical protein OsI_25655 [Oryza sativa Indica Group]